MNAQFEVNAWTFLSLDRTERLGATEVAYPDELGVRYVFDSLVAHHSAVRVGDLALIRDDKYVLGAGAIDALHTSEDRKVRQRCPTCRSTDFKHRITIDPPFRCSTCSAEFNETDKSEIVPITTYTANYSRTWQPADTSFPVGELAPAYHSRAAQHSIRQLDIAKLRPIFRRYLRADIQWFLDDGPGVSIAGGYSVVLGKTRLGQQRFREELLGHHGSICAMTGPQPPEILEAAHIRAFSTTPQHDIRNGLLLRRDLHALFDRLLITIDSSTWTIDVAPTLSTYASIAELRGRPLLIPVNRRPRAIYIDEHASRARKLWLRAADLHSS